MLDKLYKTIIYKMNKPITYSVVLTFLGNPKTVSKQLKAVPIAHRSNGSLVCMKGDDPWLDYGRVTTHRGFWSSLEFGRVCFFRFFSFLHSVE